jgi:hypothetical protein
MLNDGAAGLTAGGYVRSGIGGPPEPGQGWADGLMGQ